jgi:hypothetical protein
MIKKSVKKEIRRVEKMFPIKMVKYRELSRNRDKESKDAVEF